MAQAPPTLIDMPDPPSNPETPSEMPGTPNSTTTSLSVLSTTAIKDGHRGTALPSFTHPMHSHLSANLEAERADRISRLAGLERVSGARPNQTNAHGQLPGYFDANGNPVYMKQISTVGSASATGSLAGGQTTTWASGSMDGEGTEVSTDTHVDGTNEEDRYSVGHSEDGDRMSEGNASLVGFGEGAGSTVSGPTYNRGTGRAGGGSATGVEAAERIVRERLDQGEASGRLMGTPGKEDVGKFYFEK